MLIVYEAIHLTPENLSAIKKKLDTTWHIWDELVTQRMEQKEEFYIVFDFVKHDFQTPSHIVMPMKVVQDRCDIAVFNEAVHWISEK